MESLLESKNILKFFHLIGKLKDIPRTGWVLRDVKNPECIAGHMYRMGIMAMMLPDSFGLDVNKCLKMALVHDLAECIVGDLTPYCGVSVEEKHRREKDAIDYLAGLTGEAGSSLLQLYQEYADQKSEESKFVKDLDRLDMIMQAYDYETAENSPGRLQEFFDSSVQKFTHPWTKTILNELLQQRNSVKS